MRSIHPARRRVLLGLLLLAATVFYMWAPSCGLLGRLFMRASSHLLGQTGSTLMALTMFVSAICLLVPHGAVGRLWRWFEFGRGVHVARAVEPKRAGQPLSPADAEVVRRIVRELLREQEQEPEHQEPVKGEIENDDALAPTDRIALEAVGGALKELGYKKREYAHIVAKMNPRLAPEILVRDALKQIRAQSN